MVAALQWIGTGLSGMPRKLLWTAAGKLAMGPDCCCTAPSRCDEPFIAPDPGEGCNYLSDIGAAGCIVLPAVATNGDVCDIDDFQAWLATISFDVTLPAAPTGWYEGADGPCLLPALKYCIEMDGAILVAEHSSIGFAVGSLTWLYPPEGAEIDHWCGGVFNAFLSRTLYVRVQCMNVASPGDPEDLRCHIEVELTFTNDTVPAEANHYIWRTQTPRKLDLENLGVPVPLELPLVTKEEDIGVASICKLTGDPPITIQTH